MRENITTADKEVIPFGLAYQPLQTELARQGKLAEMRLSTYLASRMNMPKWFFISAEIIEKTGVGKKAIYKLCRELVEAEIFTVRSHGGCRATTYNFDK